MVVNSSRGGVSYCELYILGSNAVVAHADPNLCRFLSRETAFDENGKPRYSCRGAICMVQSRREVLVKKETYIVDLAQVAKEADEGDVDIVRMTKDLADCAA